MPPPNDIFSLSKFFAEAALYHPGSTMSPAMVSMLETMKISWRPSKVVSVTGVINENVTQDRLVIAHGHLVVAITDVINEIARHRDGVMSRVYLPHDAVRILDEISVILTGKPIPLKERSAVIPGTWSHEGIEIGSVISVVLSDARDPFRHPDMPRGPRRAQVEIVSFSSDMVCMEPYINFRDLEYPNEGQYALRLDDFRHVTALAEAAAPTVSSPFRP